MAVVTYSLSDSDVHECRALLIMHVLAFVFELGIVAVTLLSLSLIHI